MPAVLKSILSQALKAIADKGENVPIDLVKKRLSARGVRADEMEGAELDYMLDNLNVYAPSAKWPYPNDTVLTRSGNVAITPEGIRRLDVDRFDRDAIDTDFKTREDTQAQHEIKAQEGMEDGPTGNPVIEAQEELWRLQAYRHGLPEGDADIRIIDEEIEEAAYNLELEQTAAVTNPDVLREQVEEAEDYILQLQAERARLPEGDGNVWVIDEEIAEKQADIIRYNTAAANILPEDVARSMAAEQYARTNSPLRDIYGGITPEDVDLDTYGIAIFKDPRDVRQPGSKVSAHFGYLDEADYSYHMRYDIEPDENAFRVFEMQSDLVPVGEQFNFEQWKRHGESQRDRYLSKTSDTKLRNLQDQLEDIDTEMAAETGKKWENTHWLNLRKKYNETLKSARKILSAAQSISLPDISETKNMINRALVMGENKGTQEVKFLINPEEEVWAGRMARTEEVQKHYETVVAGQIRSVAKKIGASVRSDKAGYLIVGLPAAGFTLPLYAEENKEASYLATADLRGEDTEEAREYLNSRQPQSPPPLPEDRIVRGDFNIGGQVIEIIANIAASIIKNSKKPITESAATEAAENIVKQVNMQQTDKFSDVPVLISTDDPDYAEFLETEVRVLLREKHDLPSAELEEQFGLLSDPDNFSKRRGYTEKEIQDFNRSGELQEQIEIETGVDLMDETHLIQNALDDIQARDIDYGGELQSPPPLPEGRIVRGDFNTGGKVLGSLHRNCG